jgi:hypothetical protein
MFVKPAGKFFPLAGGHGLDSGFNLFHAHGLNFTAPGTDCELKVACRLVVGAG